MACYKFTTGIARDCKRYQPGVLQTIFVNRADITSYALDPVSKKLNSVTLAPNGRGYYVEFAANKSSFTVEQNEPNPLTRTIKCTLKGMISEEDHVVRNTLQEYIDSEIVVFVKTKAGYWRVFGLVTDPAYATVSYNTGEKAGDERGYTLTVTSEEQDIPLHVDDTVITMLIPNNPTPPGP